MQIKGEPYTRDNQMSAWVDMIHVGIIAINKNGYIEFINGYGLKLLELKRAEVMNKHVSTILPNSGILDVLEFEDEMHSAVSLPNDKHFALHAKPFYDHNQQLLGSIAIIQSAEHMETLNTSYLNYMMEKGMQGILDLVSDALLICDARGKILNMNRHYEKLFEVNKKEVIGNSIRDLMYQCQVSDAVELYVIKTGESVSKEVAFQRDANKKVTIDSVPVYAENGELCYIVSRAYKNNSDPLPDSKESNTKFDHNDNELLQNVIAKSPEMKKVIAMAKHVAAVDTNVLILGESGVGKEVIAEIVHHLSARHKGPLVKINCGAIPESLLESELFGYEKGAFTGAHLKGKVGLFELAQNGTIFLDEIGEMPPHVQVKLLRAIQEKEIMRIGGTKVINLDVRIIAATNQDLEKMIDQGVFREDLYYRINVVPLKIPPLRERRDDIEELIFYFLYRINAKYGFRKKINREAVDVLLNYSWPGNVRELENVMERMVVMASSDIISIENIPNKILEEVNNEQFIVTGIRNKNSLKEIISKYEKNVIMETLKLHKSIRKAAKALKVDHSTLVRKIQKYHLDDRKEE